MYENVTYGPLHITPSADAGCKNNPFICLAISQKLKAVMGPAGDKSKMEYTSEEMIKAGEYIIERGVYRMINSDGSVDDQGK